MSRVGRRDVLRAGVLGAGLGAVAFAVPPARAAMARIAIPEMPMRLTRRVERGFARGERVGVTRSWEVAFDRGGRGIALSGTQLSARVEAPADLASIAAIEERRDTDDMWPILLSQEGMIIGAGGGIAAQDRAAAMREAERVIAAKRLSADEAHRHRAFLAQLHYVGGTLLAHLPEDLFFPRGEPVRRSEALVLPDGSEGRFEVVYLALRAAGRDWLGEAMREIVTRVGEEELRARENWRLEAA